MGEEWRPIKENCNYSVSNLGNVRNDHTNHIFTPCVRSCSSPYLSVVLPVGNGAYKHFNVHRLVGEAFLGIPDTGLVINHKDGDKQNNCVDNLEWVTRSENDKHAYKMGLRRSTPAHIKKAIDATKHRVRNVTTGKEYESLTAAANDIGGEVGGVSKCVLGKRKTYYGMQFELIG